MGERGQEVRTRCDSDHSATGLNGARDHEPSRQLVLLSSPFRRRCWNSGKVQLPLLRRYPVTSNRRTIPGNCYMWSAPKQPFVLPVRVRSFEDAYSCNVNKDPAAPRLDGTTAQSIETALSGATDRLVRSLVEVLRQGNIRW